MKEFEDLMLSFDLLKKAETAVFHAAEVSSDLHLGFVPILMQVKARMEELRKENDRLKD